MSRRKAGWLGIGALAVVLGLVVGVLWALRSPIVGAGAPNGRSAPSSSPRYDLAVNLRAVQGKGPGVVAKPAALAGPAAAVERTIAELYDIGFVDRTLWAGGRFPSLSAPFAPEARQHVRAHVADLTLGRAAGRLDAVRPTRARLDVRFMLDRGRHPIMAFAHMDFAGVGLAASAELRISHQGDYVLRRTDAGWRIVSFRVKSRVPSPHQVRRQVREASLSPTLPSDGPLFVLVIGSDARPRPVGYLGDTRGRHPHRGPEPEAGDRLDPGDPAGLVRIDPRGGDGQDQRSPGRGWTRAHGADRRAAHRDPHRRLCPYRVRRVRAHGESGWRVLHRYPVCDGRLVLGSALPSWADAPLGPPGPGIGPQSPRCSGRRLRPVDEPGTDHRRGHAGVPVGPTNGPPHRAPVGPGRGPVHADEPQPDPDDGAPAGRSVDRPKPGSRRGRQRERGDGGELERIRLGDFAHAKFRDLRRDGVLGQ